MVKLFYTFLPLVCMVCFTACKDREYQYIYYDEGKVKPKAIYEIDKETGLRDGSYKVYLESGVLACSLEFVEGEVKKQSCEENMMVDFRDNQVYRTVKIDNQVWMAENLNFKTDNSFCYNDSAEYCEKYGRLYTWAAAVDSVGTWSSNGKGCGYNKRCLQTYPVRGVCPSGWHLPDITEWKTLFAAVGGQSIAGKKLKVTGGWKGLLPDITNEDAFSFSALPAGQWAGSLEYMSEGSETHFWSSTMGDSNKVFEIYLDDSIDSVYMFVRSSWIGFSVRCLKDDPQEKPEVAPVQKTRVDSVPPKETKAMVEGAFKDSRDGKQYKTEQIGSQTWMAENLDYELPHSWCYEDNSENCQKLGRLYTWDAAMKACPEGWSLPTEFDWETLKAFVESENGEGKAGAALKSGGFAAQLGGDRFNDKYQLLGKNGYYWSSTEIDNKRAFDYAFLLDSDDLIPGNVKYALKANGFSVRCIKGDGSMENLEAEASALIDSRDGKEYKFVNIGAQTWMAENLNFKTPKSECLGKCKEGRLYTWKEAQQICPSGWHLPSWDEWRKLLDYSAKRSSKDDAWISLLSKKELLVEYFIVTAGICPEDLWDLDNVKAYFGVKGKGDVQKKDPDESYSHYSQKRGKDLFKFGASIVGSNSTSGADDCDETDYIAYWTSTDRVVEVGGEDERKGLFFVSSSGNTIEALCFDCDFDEIKINMKLPVRCLKD